MGLRIHRISFYNNDTTKSQPYSNFIGTLHCTYSPKGAELDGGATRSSISQEGLVVVKVIDLNSLSELPEKNDVVHIKHKDGFVEGSFIIENMHRMRNSIGIVLGKMNVAGFKP